MLEQAAAAAATKSHVTCVMAAMISTCTIQLESHILISGVQQDVPRIVDSLNYISIHLTLLQNVAN